jgi:hypothetical protein
LHLLGVLCKVYVRNALQLTHQPPVLFNMMSAPRQGAAQPRPASERPKFPAHGGPGDYRRDLAVVFDGYANAGLQMLSLELGIWNHDHEDAFSWEELWGKKDCKVPDHEGDPPKCDGASWHPGHNGHALQAAMIAYTYAQYFEKALAELAEHVDDATLSQTQKLISLPKPLFCGKGANDLFCDLPPPKCASTFAPRSGLGLTEIMLNATKYSGVWGYSQWTLQMSPGDVEELHGHHARANGYVDFKWILMGYRSAWDTARGKCRR